MSGASIRRYFLTAAGVVAVGLGLLGVFVPLLPTTPFLLLAAGCWMRSSQRLHDWLLDHRWFGDYVRNYVEYRAVRPRARLVTLVLLWGVIGAAALTAVASWWMRALLGVVAIGVTLHLLQLQSLTPEVQQSSRRCLEDRDAQGARATA
ncbi:MAG: YbaN family protein [Anaerolineae bacterium]